MLDKETIFTINQVVKKSKYSVKEIAKEAGLSESQLRTYMNSRIPPLEQYSALKDAFANLGEVELADQLVLQFLGLDWCFYYKKKEDLKPALNKIFMDLSVLQGEINKIFENIEELDEYEKMHALIHIQNMISLLHDLIRLIDKGNQFLKLWV
jgi:transcriptional regulator with XRE-family HTH domain